MIHEEWSAGPVEQGFEFVVGPPDVGHRTVLNRADAEALCEMLKEWLAEKKTNETAH